MSLRTFITQVSDLTITGVTTSYDSNEVPESLADSKLPAMVPNLPIAPPVGGQMPVVLNTALSSAFNATYSVEFVIFIRPVGQKPPSTYVREMVDYLDNFLTAIRNNDQAFAWNLTIRSPRAGILNFAGIDYVSVWFPVEYEDGDL